MTLEASVFASDWLKLLCYALFIAFAGFALYKLRSRRALAFSCLGALLLFGFFWKGCPCPIGLTQNTAAFICDSNSPYPFVYFAIFALPIIAALFFGRIFCGGACPLGALQELICLKPLKVPLALDWILRIVPYFVLIACAVYAACGGIFLACAYDPFIPIFRSAAPLYLTIFCACMILLSIFVARPYCKYLCPYSVLLKLASLVSSRRVSIAPTKCVNCKLCEASCPHGAIVAPVTGRAFETPDAGKARIRLIISLTPVFMLAGALAGYAFGMFVGQFHPSVTLLGDVQNGISNIDTDAFFSSGASVAQLQAIVALTAWKLRVGFAIGGALIALLGAFEALRISRRKENTEYEVDMGKCLCCGRCYNSCPDEVLRKNKISK